jgi:hypothetical protein
VVVDVRVDGVEAVVELDPAVGGFCHWLSYPRRQTPPSCATHGSVVVAEVPTAVAVVVVVVVELVVAEPAGGGGTTMTVIRGTAAAGGGLVVVRNGNGVVVDGVGVG